MTLGAALRHHRPSGGIGDGGADVVRPFLKLLVMDMPMHLASLRKLAAVGEARLLFTAHTGHTSEVAVAMRDWR